RDDLVTGVQTCALPISQNWLYQSKRHVPPRLAGQLPENRRAHRKVGERNVAAIVKNEPLNDELVAELRELGLTGASLEKMVDHEIGRASCRERERVGGG